MRLAVVVLPVACMLPLAGCATIPQLLAPSAAAPAPTSTSGGENAPTAAELAPKTPAVSSMQKSDYSERTMHVGGDDVRMKLPCEPKGDEDKDKSELGSLKIATYQCDYETASLSYTVIATRFDRALPASAKDSDRDAKSAAIAKIVARDACQGLKEAGTSCKVGTPLLVGGVASVNVKLGGSTPLSLEVDARYPLAVAVLVGGGDGAAEARTKAMATLELPAP